MSGNKARVDLIAKCLTLLFVVKRYGGYKIIIYGILYVHTSLMSVSPEFWSRSAICKALVDCDLYKS